MKPQKKYFIVLSLFTVCLFFSTAQAQIIDRILAIVDNEIITQVQLEKTISAYKKQIQAARMSQDQRQQVMDKLKNTMLEQLIDRSLARQEAQKYQISVADADVEAAIENMRAQNNLTPSQFAMALKAEGWQLKDYKEQIRQEILQSRLVNQVVRSKVVVTESDIRQYYDEHRQEYQNPETYHLRNILVPTRYLADKILEKLGEGESFLELAKKHSMYPNADSGGDLGSFSMDSVSPVIRDAVQDLKKSNYSDVLETEQGYQIFFVEDIIPAGGKSFEQVRQSVHDKLYKAAEKEKFVTWIASLKEHAHIEIKDGVPGKSEQIEQ